MIKAAIVDYDKENIVTILKYLETNDNVFSAIGFDNEEYYLKSLKEKNIDIAFIRLGNSEFEGTLTAKETLRISPDTSVVFMSDNTQHRTNDSNEENYRYLTMPAEENEIKNIINLAKSHKLANAI